MSPMYNTKNKATTRIVMFLCFVWFTILIWKRNLSSGHYFEDCIEHRDQVCIVVNLNDKNSLSTRTSTVPTTFPQQTVNSQLLFCLGSYLDWYTYHCLTYNAPDFCHFFPVTPFHQSLPRLFIFAWPECQLAYVGDVPILSFTELADY